MKNFKRALSLILALVMCLALFASCTKKDDDKGGDTAADGKKYAKELDVIVDNNKIAVVNPFLSASNTAPTCWVFNMIYDKLVDNNGDGTYTPRLAKEWITDDWQTITMKLRDDVYFTNGEKFTANDIIYTMNTAVEAVGTQVADRWNGIVSATADDDYTITFVLEAVNVDFLYNMSQPQSGIVNEKAMTEDPENGVWVGTGAWYITDFATNDYVKMARNEDYWGEKAITEKITLRFVPEESARLMMLENGETDVCFSINPNDLKAVEENTDKYVTYPFVYNNIDMIGFNMADPIVGDYNFRMAVAHALDREEITLAACGDYGIAETEGTFWGYETEFRNRDIPMIPHDIEKAKEYLAKSPYNGEVIEIATAISTNITASEVIQQQLRKIGVETNIYQTDPPSIGAYAGYADNKSQILVYVNPITLSAHAIRNTYYPGAGYNRTSYNNDAVTALLDKAPTITDMEERKAVYYELQELVAQDPNAFNLFYLVSLAACQKGVDGMKLPADSYFDLTYIYKEID